MRSKLTQHAVSRVRDLRDAPAARIGTACHSAKFPPINRPYRRRARKSPETVEYIGSNYIQIKPQMQIVRPESSKPSKRGKIQGMSSKSMRNLKRKCAMMEKHHSAYTFALTYGEQFPDAKGSKAELVRLQRWVCKKFPTAGFFWKREPQKRGATHYHFLAFLGEDHEKSRDIALRILIKWCDIANSSYGSGQYEKALKVHTFIDEKNWGTDKDTRSNFQLMKGANFFNYLAKYIAKSADAMPDGYDLEGGGKWWGYFNRASLPWGEESVSNYDEFSRAKNKQLERIVYNVRQHRAIAACDNATSEQVKENDSVWSFNGHSKQAEIYLNQALKKNGVVLSPSQLRKQTRKVLDPERRWKKAKKLRREGSVTILGNIEHIKESLHRFMNDHADHEARRRIFSDDWQMPGQTNLDAPS